MQNRVPTAGQEGRVLITPEDGSAPFFARVSMADNPTQPGTPFSKETMLKDATAALFGLEATAVPDDVFNAILSFYPRFSAGYYDGTGESNIPQYLYFDFPVKIVFICTSQAVGNVWRNAYDFGIIFNGLAPFAYLNTNYKGDQVRYGYLYFNQGEFLQDENCILPDIEGNLNRVRWEYNQTGFPERQFNRLNCRYNYIAFG